jgi:NADH:ubiquinone oxidoreductase subunit 5 (subunit L)/multisubunit Na+/H+ antiporter MnhA subunit
MLLAGGGIALAWATYQREAIAPSRLSSALAPIDYMARRRYGLDGVYAALYRLLLLGLSRAIGWVDRYLVDGVLNVLSAEALRAGDMLRRLQTGQPQDYVYGVAVGVLLLLVWAHLTT